MSRHRIGILSDTHSLLREEVKETLKTCEVILHMGDIASQECHDAITQLADAYFVRGNADKEWAEGIPMELELELFGFRFYMVHNKKHQKELQKDCDVILYGHSHKYEEIKKEGQIILNPGSCGPRRFHQPVTMAVMTIEEESHTCVIEKCDFSPMLKPTEMKLPQKDMDRLIRSIVKDMNAGRKIETIAHRNRVTVDFVNQILQIYTTHPGIDVEGIMNRMDIWGK